MLETLIIGLAFLGVGGFFIYLDMKSESKPFKIMSIILGVFTGSLEYILFLAGLIIIVVAILGLVGIGKITVY